MSPSKQKISAHLSKELRFQYKRRSIGVRKGDEVRIVRGEHAGKSGAVSEVDKKFTRIFVSGITLKRTVGTEKQVPIEPSNIVITNLNLDDNARQRILLRKVKEVKVEKPKTVEPKPAEEKLEAGQKAETKKEEKHETKEADSAEVLASGKKRKEVGSIAKARAAQKV